MIPPEHVFVVKQGQEATVVHIYMVSEEKGAALISNRFLSSELSALVFVRTKTSGCVPYSCVACLLVCLFA